jgi:hypothetical protein
MRKWIPAYAGMTERSRKDIRGHGNDIGEHRNDSEKLE